MPEEGATNYRRNYGHRSSRRPDSRRIGSKDDHRIEECLHVCNRRNEFAALNEHGNALKDKAGSTGNANDVVREALNNETTPGKDVRKILRDKHDVTTDTTIPQLPPSSKPVIPRNANTANTCRRNNQYDLCFRNNRPAKSTDWETKETEGLKDGSKSPLKGTLRSMNDCSDLSLSKRSHPMAQGNDSPVTAQGNDSPVTAQGNESLVTAQGNDSPVTPQGNESLVTAQGNESPVTPQGNESPVTPQGNESPVMKPITGECKEPQNYNTDESASKSSDVVSSPVSKNPTRGSLPQSKRRPLALLRSSGCSISPGDVGISCSTGGGNGGGYMGGCGNGGGAGRTGRGGDRTGRRGEGVSGRGDESGDVSGSGDGSGSGRGRGGRESGGSGDSKRDKKGGGKKGSVAVGSSISTRMSQRTGTLDSGLGTEKSTLDIHIGTDIADSVQGTAKLKNGSLLVPCQAQQQETGESTLPVPPLLAVGIPSSHLPSLTNTVGSSGPTPKVFVRPEKVAESCEFPVQESQDYPDGGLLYLDPLLFLAVPDFGLQPVVKPFSAGYGGESKFENADLLLPYAFPVSQSQDQPVGTTSTVSNESSDSVETHTDVGETNNPPRRHFSPRPFFEMCGELPQVQPFP